jgi:hypothetical protein
VQQRHTAPQELLYTRRYWYRSGQTQTMVQELTALAHEIQSRVPFTEDDVVLDIGCLPDGFVYGDAFVQRDIREVKTGDMVLGRSGFVRVTNTFMREYDGELVAVRLLGDPRVLRLTPHHKVLVVPHATGSNLTAERAASYYAAAMPQWRAAEALREGDYCLMPPCETSAPLITEIFMSATVQCETDGDTAYAQQRHGATGAIQRASNQNPVPERYPLTEAFGRLLGYYIAEGSGDGVTCEAFSFSFHTKETEYVADVQQLVASVFGLKTTLSAGNGQTAVVSVSSALVKRFMQALVGSGAANKRLPPFVFAAPVEFVTGLLTGMFRGDGSFTAGMAKYDTVSEVLAYHVKALLLRFGVNSSVMPNKPNGFGKANGKTLLSVRIFGKADLGVLSRLVGEVIPCQSNKSQVNWPQCRGMTLVRIVSAVREQYAGPVYNLETTDNSYVASSAIVHNSNDGTFLRAFTKPCTKVGVEPATNLHDEGARGIDMLIRDFWDVDVDRPPYLFGDSSCLAKRAKVITALGMFYDLDNPGQFIADVAKVLAPDGVFVAQFMGLKQMMATNDIGNLCHEHIEFWTLKSLSRLLDKCGLEIFDVAENKVNGGSYRLWIRHKSDAFCSINDHEYDFKENRLVRRESATFPSFSVEAYDRVTAAFKAEAHLDSPEYHREWFRRLELDKERIVSFIRDAVLEHRKAWCFGASTKGNTILQWLGLNANMIEAAVDKSAEKVGRYTVNGIPIRSEEEFRKANPHFALILPYAFVDEFVEREKAWLKRGGKFIVPLPKFHVIENMP